MEWYKRLELISLEFNYAVNKLTCLTSICSVFWSKDIFIKDKWKIRSAFPRMLGQSIVKYVNSYALLAYGRKKVKNAKQWFERGRGSSMIKTQRKGMNMIYESWTFEHSRNINLWKICNVCAHRSFLYRENRLKSNQNHWWLLTMLGQN